MEANTCAFDLTWPWNEWKDREVAANELLGQAARAEVRAKVVLPDRQVSTIPAITIRVLDLEAAQANPTVHVTTQTISIHISPATMLDLDPPLAGTESTVRICKTIRAILKLVWPVGDVRRNQERAFKLLEQHETMKRQNKELIDKFACLSERTFGTMHALACAGEQGNCSGQLAASQRW